MRVQPQHAGAGARTNTPQAFIRHVASTGGGRPRALVACCTLLVDTVMVATCTAPVRLAHNNRERHAVSLQAGACKPRHGYGWKCDICARTMYGRAGHAAFMKSCVAV